jgi:hypothetical protein
MTRTDAACQVADGRGEVCDHGHFLGSSSAARDWISRHPDVRTLAVRDTLEQSHTACQDLGWLATGASLR